MEQTKGSTHGWCMSSLDGALVLRGGRRVGKGRRKGGTPDVGWDRHEVVQLPIQHGWPGSSRSKVPGKHTARLRAVDPLRPLPNTCGSSRPGENGVVEIVQKGGCGRAGVVHLAAAESIRWLEIGERAA